MRSLERVNIQTNVCTYVRTHIHTYGTDPISPPQLCCARGKQEFALSGGVRFNILIQSDPMQEMFISA